MAAKFKVQDNKKNDGKFYTMYRDPNSEGAYRLEWVCNCVWLCCSTCLSELAHVVVWLTCLCSWYKYRLLCVKYCVCMCRFKSTLVSDFLLRLTTYCCIICHWGPVCQRTYQCKRGHKDGVCLMRVHFLTFSVFLSQTKVPPTLPPSSCCGGLQQPAS